MVKSQLNIGILGAGESGIGAAILAKTKGFNVFVSDSSKISFKFINELNENEIEWEELSHSNKILDSDLVVKSPGIPNYSSIINLLKKRGVEVIGEVEFASRFTDKPIIAITGSNGKTTTTHLLTHILKKGGLKAEMAGNVGESFSRKVLNSNIEIFVLELSSFQLEDIVQLKPSISILLNITPDHLDRYQNSIKKYGQAKLKITKNQTSDNYFIYNSDDLEILKQIRETLIVAKRIPFSLKEEVAGGFLTNNQIIIKIKNKLTMSIHELALKGKHNIQNSLAAGIAARIMEIRKDIVRESLMDFSNVEHRLEFVAKINGVEYINDSKATNVNSTWYALESMDKPTIWIVGGVDKGNDYSELLPLVKEKVKAIICLGKNNQKIIESFKTLVGNIYETQSAMEAVAYGYKLAKKNETVLLSPACASFDLFENFEDRGTQFKNAVRLL